MSNASRTAAQLRQDFDQSFAEAVHDQAEPREDFLAVRLGDDAHAIRLADITNLLQLTALTRIPSPVPELLGSAGFRGTVVPVS